MWKCDAHVKRDKFAYVEMWNMRDVNVMRKCRAPLRRTT